MSSWKQELQRPVNKPFTTNSTNKFLKTRALT